MSRVTSVIFGVLLLGLIVESWIGMYQVWEREMAQFEAENQCIQQYIYQGIERRNIVRDNGVCYVKEENP